MHGVVHRPITFVNIFAEKTPEKRIIAFLAFLFREVFSEFNYSGMRSVIRNDDLRNLGRDKVTGTGCKDIVDLDIRFIRGIRADACRKQIHAALESAEDGLNDLTVRCQVKISHQYGGLVGIQVLDDGLNRIAGFCLGETHVSDQDGEELSFG